MTSTIGELHGTGTGTAEPPFLQPRIAIVEDDEELREKIMVPALRAAGFDAVGLASALELYRTWAGSPFDLVLLDVGLPDDDGVEIARYLRGLSPSLGIVMYTGHGRTADRVRGLRAGVDAYLVKPADMDEVIETLRNVRERRGNPTNPSTSFSSGWVLDRQGWSLLAPSGIAVTLNQAERQIMRALSASPGEPVPREALIANLTCDTGGFDPHRLEMLVYRLRRKCQETAGETLPLQAVRGVGYLFGP